MSGVVLDSVMQDNFEGYINGEITYCVDPANDEFFPVRVVAIGRKFVDVESIDAELTKRVAPQFDADQKNRRFVRPKLGKRARFGGCDERTVNAERTSVQELRLLPYHYGTYTGGKIRERNRENPVVWPLPTGIVFERWFKEVEA